LRQVYDAFFDWVDANVEEAVVKFVPKDVADLIAVYGVHLVLDM
jgi:hypothetical protein